MHWNIPLVTYIFLDIHISPQGSCVYQENARERCIIGHFQISLNLFLKASLGAHPFIWKWDFIHLQIKPIFIWMAVHQASLWWRGLGELGNGLLVPDAPKVAHQMVFKTNKNNVVAMFSLTWDPYMSKVGAPYVCSLPNTNLITQLIVRLLLKVSSWELIWVHIL